MSHLYNSQVNGRSHMGLVDPNGAFGAGRQEEQILSFGDLLRTVWRRMWIIVLVPLVFTGLGAGYNSSQTPIYQSSATILIGPQPVDNSTSEAGNDLYDIQWFMPTLTEAANTRPLAADVAQRLGSPVSPEYVYDGMAVEQIPETQILSVSFRDANPEKAQLIANTLADTVSERLPDLGPNGSGYVSATVWEQAALPEFPVSPNLSRNVLLALTLGLMLGLGLAFLVDHLDDRWRSIDEVERLAGIPTFGVIPESRGRRKKRDHRSLQQGSSRPDSR